MTIEELIRDTIQSHTLISLSVRYVPASNEIVVVSGKPGTPYGVGPDLRTALFSLRAALSGQRTGPHVGGD